MIWPFINSISGTDKDDECEYDLNMKVILMIMALMMLVKMMMVWFY